MIALILNALTGGLLKAWQAKLTADSDEKRLIADAAIADIKAQSEARQHAAQTPPRDGRLVGRCAWLQPS